MYIQAIQRPRTRSVAAATDLVRGRCIAIHMCVCTCKYYSIYISVCILKCRYICVSIWCHDKVGRLALGVEVERGGALMSW